MSTQLLSSNNTILSVGIRVMCHTSNVIYNIRYFNTGLRRSPNLILIADEQSPLYHDHGCTRHFKPRRDNMPITDLHFMSSVNA